ncbi:MAG TPA: GPMC system MBL fold metallohydrolase [Thermodesulfobacteriota bacterium]|nr:GPMC system MBL fold metallohydrolase [Thermodesulfobacteriota bacterium]
MKLRILGCGTSTGVPVIGCHCGVCTSKDPRNKRMRSSALVRTNGKNILIDTSTDLRSQSLANGIERIDSVLFTHPHADHIHGIDDLRAFNLTQNAEIPCYGSLHTVERIKVMFDYIFRVDSYDGWKPRLSMTAVDSPFEASGVTVVPVGILHGSARIFGYRIGSMAYLTDCSSIPEESLGLLEGLEVLVLGALRHKPHPTHFTIEQAVEASRAIKAKRTFFTHLGHSLDYTKDNSLLPDGIELAYDGLEVEF